MKFLFAATLLLLSVFGKDEINILDMIKEQMESMDAKKIHADMVEANPKYIEQMEKERREVLKGAKEYWNSKDNSEDLAERETYINEVYDKLIKDSSVIESEEEIAKSIEDGKKMIEAFKIEDPEKQDAAIKELMMKQVKPEENKDEAEKQIDEMLKGMRVASENFKSMINMMKEVGEIEPTEEQKETEKYLKSLFAKLIKEDVVEEEESKEEVTAQGSGLGKRLINNEDIVYNSSSEVIYG